MDFFITPIAHVRSARPTNCVVNALVLATPISGPALVKNIKSEFLVILDSAELEMQSVVIFLLIFLAIF